jgi:spore coat protein U-like protein
MIVFRVFFMACLPIFLLATLPQNSHAAINCSISSPGISSVYTGAFVVTQSFFTISCTRAAADPLTSVYSVTPDNGLYNAGPNNRAALGANRLNHEDWQDSACSVDWRSAPPSAVPISGTVDFGNAATLSTQAVRNFWVCIPAAQTYAAGIYTDLVTLTLTYNNGSVNTNALGTYPINISTQPTCSISAPPATLSFDYTSFQNNPALASSNFGTTCSLDMPYTLSLGSAFGVLSGLNYTLGINNIASGGGVSLNSTGTGVEQTFYINGTMPESQAGTCSTATCSATQGRTLTISF